MIVPFQRTSSHLRGSLDRALTPLHPSKQNGLSPSVESLFRLFVGTDENPKRNPRLESRFHRSRARETQAAAAAVLRAGRSTLSGTTTAPSSSSGDNNSSSHAENSTKTMSSVAKNNTSFHTDGSSSTCASSSSCVSSTAPSSEPVATTSAAAASDVTSVASAGPAKSAGKARFGLTLVGLTQGLMRRFPVLEEPLGRILETLSTGVTWMESLARHPCCPHQHSCLSYILKGGSSMFAAGYGLQAAISTLSVITTVLRRPGALKDTLFSRLNLKLAAFMGAYSAVFRAVNCILRWIRGKDAPIHGLVGGALAGLSLRFYRSVTIALYAATKLVEILYFKGIESYGFPYIKSADIFIYAFSTAFIFHAAVMEPHTLRPGYWKFLLRVTGNRFAMMNRRLLDVFGVNSSKIAPDYWPDYDPAFTELARGPS
ncbi:transmembrane protein 135 [Elysia marginata]|uniref:Transmembrane protein 135 n=1 Tax=Elysia marginata TaxID=1093978 RepID=A0AAV4HEZ3_9GAST|nr:transmembrane protein 135 [Elysia marginata]